MSLNRFQKVVFWLFFVVFLSYLLFRLYGNIVLLFHENLKDSNGFIKYVLGWLLILSVVVVLGLLNYRWLFTTCVIKNNLIWLYWSWIVALAWIVFELLQIRTEHEDEFADENLLVTSIIIGFIVIFGYFADAIRVKNERLILQQQKSEAELNVLKAQINPHFFFNILNTIYNEAAESKNDKIANLVEQLAGIMRFSLQETQKQTTSIENEISFLEKYINLQRARLPIRENINIEIDIDFDGQPTCIAPLLLIPFVENAFQYGISFDKPSFLKLSLYVENQILDLKIKNSTWPKPFQSNGLGISNVQKRLHLLYRNRHWIKIENSNNTFEVTLKIELFKPAFEP